MHRTVKLYRTSSAFLSALVSGLALAAPASEFATDRQGWNVVDFNCCYQYSAPMASYAANWHSSGGAAGLHEADPLGLQIGRCGA